MGVGASIQPPQRSARKQSSLGLGTGCPPSPASAPVVYSGWYEAEIRIGTIVSPQWMRSTAWSRTTDGK